MGRSYSANYMVTIGADFAIKEIDVEDTKIKFQIRDLAGQPCFETIRSLYYRGAMGALLVFDVTRMDSFQSKSAWVRELWNNNGKTKVPMVVLGNRIDLRDNFPEGIIPQNGQHLAKTLSEDCSDARFTVDYVETSAKIGQNVVRAFSLLGQNILRFIDKYTAK